jgi:hypothetical protein
MKQSLILRRAALLGTAIGLAGCDIAEFAANPMPRFEQTWNLPAPSMSVSVGSLLPTDNSVQILPDSSAFAVSISGTSITRRVGADCSQCETLNGTNAFKPAFVLNAGNSSGLPADVVSAAVTNGTVSIQLTNNMSFDPLFVRTNPGPQTQGYMLIVIRSGSLVLGRDSVNGATTTFAPGTQLTRIVPLTTGTITNSITVDVTIDSPQGDHNEFINANGTLNAVAAVPTLHVASVGLNVPGRRLTSSQVELDLSEFDGIGDPFQGVLEMTISNPFAVSGAVGMRFRYGPAAGDVFADSVAFAGGSGQVRRLQLDSARIARLIGNNVNLEVTGTVTSTAPVIVTPRQVISLANRFILKVRTGGGN